MIEKMKKLTFLVTAKEYEPFPLDLREAGVVHVQELQQGATSPALQEALSLTKRYEDAMQRMENVLKTYEQAGEVPALPSFGSPLALLEHIEALEEEKTRLLHVIDSRKARIEQLTPWGEFSLEELERWFDVSTGSYRINANIIAKTCAAKGRYGGEENWWWWTRTSDGYHNQANCVMYVSEKGIFSGNDATYTGGGVRPTITIHVGE